MIFILIFIDGGGCRGAGPRIQSRLVYRDTPSQTLYYVRKNHTKILRKIYENISNVFFVMKYTAEAEQELANMIFSMEWEIEALIMYMFPWGEEGTPLERYAGPKKWQLRVIRKLDAQLKRNRQLIAYGKDPEPLYMARSSGRGIGKSALFAMIVMAFMSVKPGITIQISANTEEQLRSKTMAELGKWHTLAINSHWFEKTVMSLVPAKWFGDVVKRDFQINTDYYYAKGVTWSEENPDAFAGTHSDVGVILIFDEASGIKEPIWNVSEGFFTDLTPVRFWINFSNPRRATGAFFECFNKHRDHWDTESIDSRDVEGLDHSVFRRIIDKYGEDHDVSRVEVKGTFPRQGIDQFISNEVVKESQQRDVEPDNGAPLLMGVDVARFGDDSSVIRFRQGRDARSFPKRRFKGRDTMELVSEITALANDLEPDMIFVDGGGVGGGVVDRLVELGYKVSEVQFGGKADEKQRYFNKKAEIWDRMKDWLQRGAIDDSDGLFTDLTSITYKHIGDSSQICMEKGDEMKKRGLSSPDEASALAVTFAEKVARRDSRVFRGRGRSRQARGLDDPIFD